MPTHLFIVLMLLQAMYLLHAVLGNFLPCVPFARLDSKGLLLHGQILRLLHLPTQNISTAVIMVDGHSQSYVSFLVVFFGHFF